MADVLNRTTCELRCSVNTPDFDEAEWIINPDLSAVEKVPCCHWKVDGDKVVEMNQAEKDQVDADKLSAEAALPKGPLAESSDGSTWEITVADDGKLGAKKL